ncbi:MAG: polyprenyl synthetase family protein [Planctomycetota bacterium]|nr:MAG: polyprenyl synthetase family protein [Planctomycetota bacterium]
MSLLARDIMEPVLEGMAETDRILREEILTDHAESVLALMEHVSQFSGKRLRPAMVHLCGGLVGSHAHELATIGAMLEALHMATLLHDDVLDRADVRRKVPTLNALHGNEVPVLLGDMIYARTFDLSLKLPTLVAAREMSLMTQNLCRGEIDQNFFKFDGHPDEERYFSVIKAKTASMFKSSCFLGIHYGGGSDSQAHTMACFGIDLGVAFQIIDDCLDVVGDERVAGKSLGTDLETGKVTLPVIRLAQGLDAAGVGKLSELLNDPDPGDRRARLCDEFPLEAAVRTCHQEADRFLHGCLETLADFPDGVERQSLMDLCSFVLERSY